MGRAHPALGVGHRSGNFCRHLAWPQSVARKAAQVAAPISQLHLSRKAKGGVDARLPSGRQEEIVGLTAYPLQPGTQMRKHFASPVPPLCL